MDAASGLFQGKRVLYRFLLLALRSTHSLSPNPTFKVLEFEIPSLDPINPKPCASLWGTCGVNAMLIGNYLSNLQTKGFGLHIPCQTYPCIL